MLLLQGWSGTASEKLPGHCRNDPPYSLEQIVGDWYLPNRHGPADEVDV